MRRVIKLGVTGGIASGKSRAISYLKELGAQVISSDELGHQTYLPGSPTYHKIIQEFGSGIVNEDGKINRTALGTTVFGNPAAVKRLSDIVWPAVFEKEMKQKEELLQQNTSLPPVVVLEAALLVEAGWRKYFDKLWVFTVPPQVAQQRIMARNNLTWEEAGKRLASQMSNEERTQHADVVFDTNRDADLVKQDVVKEWNSLLSSAKL